MNKNKNIIRVFVIGMLIVTTLVAAQKPVTSQISQPTYTPRPTYTPLPTYTPQLSAAATTSTPLPTSTPYGETSSPATEIPVIKTSMEDQLKDFFESDPILAEGYRFGEFFRSNRIMNNEKGYCFSINQINPGRRFGEICLFLDGAQDLPGFERLQNYAIQIYETEVMDAPQMGDLSIMFSGKEEGEEYFRGGAINGAWSIGYHFSSFDEMDVPSEIGLIFESFFDKMDPTILRYSPAESTQNGDYSSRRIKSVLSAVSFDGLIENYLPVEIRTENMNGITTYSLIILYEGFDKQAGVISIYPFNNLYIDHHQTAYSIPEFEPYTKPIITGGEIIGDRSVMFKFDENPAGQMIVQRFQKYDLFVDVKLMNNGSNSVKDAREIANRVADLIEFPELEDFRPNGNVLEQQLLNCFPAQGDLGFDRPMTVYTWSTDMHDHGFEYSTRYTDFRIFDHWGPVGIVTINMKTFVTPMTGQDIPIYNENEYSILLDHQNYSDIGDRSQGWLFHNTYNRPQTYDSGLYFQKGNVLVEIGYSQMAESEEPPIENILEILSGIARSMDQCLPENPDLPREISVPSTITGQVSAWNSIEIIEINGPDGGENPTVNGLTVVPLPVNLRFNIKVKLDAPLTFAIYNPERGFYTYRKQEKEIPPIGDYYSILRTEGYSTFIEGVNELHVWSGDELILIYPFVLSKSWGDRG